METIVIYVIQDKTEKDYSFKKEGRAGNPTSIYPQNFKPVRVLHEPPGTAERLEKGNTDEIERIRAKLQEEGYAGHTVQLRAARGGVGAGRHFTVKAGIRSGAISTEGRGFHVLVRRLEI